MVNKKKTKKSRGGRRPGKVFFADVTLTVLHLRKTPCQDVYLSAKYLILIYFDDMISGGIFPDKMVAVYCLKNRDMV